MFGGQIIEKVNVSIIIPVYNCEEYLSQCIDSVIEQTCPGIEVICINDGSTDCSSLILKEYANHHLNIKVINQDNQGAGSARNCGIEHATGKYLAFLDGDDYYIDETAIESMFLCCEKNGIAACGSKRKNLVNGHLRDADLFRDIKKEMVISYSDIQIDYDYQSFILRKDILSDITFPKYRRFQDPPFLVRALYKAEQFAVVNKFLYCYRVPAVASRFDESKINDLLNGLYDNLRFAKQHSLDGLYSKTIERLDYEYGDIIYNNMSMTNLSALELLLEMNKMIYGYGSQNMLRTLRRIMNVYGLGRDSYDDKLCKQIMNQNHIAIYGAGRLANNFSEYLMKHGLFGKVDEYIVTDIIRNEILNNIKVKTISDCNDKEKVIYIATGVESQKKIYDMLVGIGFINVIMLDTVFLERCV